MIIKIQNLKNKLENYKTKVDNMDKKDRLIKDLDEIIEDMTNRLSMYDSGIEAEENQQIKEDAENYRNILNHSTLNKLINSCSNILCYYDSTCDDKLSAEEINYELSILANNEYIVSRSISDMKNEIEEFKNNPDVILP